MTKDYSVPALEGPGDNDYARYMRTDDLLSLQRRAEEMVHRDELLFQTVHQSTELWLNHACFEVEEAAQRIERGEPEVAARLVSRGALGVELITAQLEMMRHLTPAAFQVVRTALGNGSGLESPGWRGVQRVSRRLGKAFDEVVAREGVDLVELYHGSPDDPLYRLAEALVEWDDRIGMWRARHYKIATRVIGHSVVGTKGAPVDALARLVTHKFFPELWRVRTEVTERGPLAADLTVDPSSPLVAADAGSPQ